MTPVFQATKFDCLSACVASVLDLPLSEIPLWWELSGDDWIEAIKNWAESRGLGFVYFDLKDRTQWPVLHGFYGIAAGPTPRSAEYFHAVVVKAVHEDNRTRLEFIHDPCPNGNFIMDFDHLIFFVHGSRS